MSSFRLMLSVTSLMRFVGQAHAVKPGSSPNDLCSVTQNWDKKLPNAARFTILTEFDSEAVRDNETGLVWERSLAGGAEINWASASYTCINKSVAGRKAWRCRP